MPTKTSDELEINITLVKELISEQFPQWARLPIKPVPLSGWDNRTFRLGEQMTVRLPSGQEYAGQILKEQKWLPFLASHLSYLIPTPLGLGKPSAKFPFNWSVNNWIEGKNADTLPLIHQEKFARDIAYFLKELQSIASFNGPLNDSGRGSSPILYNTETQTMLKQLHGIIDVNTAKQIWEKAINCPSWKKNPVWFHGDMSVGNILVKENKLAAVIDFGCMGIGDPACDLVIAWTFLTKENRRIFRKHVGLDSNTWARARGWALWKALITLGPLKDMRSPEALKQRSILNEILTDHKLEK